MGESRLDLYNDGGGPISVHSPRQRLIEDDDVGLNVEDEESA
jgi:hypothetical protein